MGLMSFFGLSKAKEQVIEKKSYSVSDYAFFMNNNGMLLPDVSSLNINLLIKHYESVNPLASGIKKISNAVGMLPIILYDKRADKQVASHAILDLLYKPNNEEQKTKKDFMRDIAIWKILEGNAYINLVGLSEKSRQLYVLNPKNMTITPDGKGYPGNYLYTTGYQSETFTRSLSTNRYTTRDGSGELMHLRNFNPNYSNGDLKGRSEILPMFFEIMQYLEASNHNLKLLTNGARPSGALVIKNKDGSQLSLSEEDFARLKNELAESYSGSVNSGKPLILEGGLEWQEMSINPKDMDFATLKKSAEMQIYTGLEIPLQLMMPDATTFNNMATAELGFYKNRVIPFSEDILHSLNSWLIPLYKGAENLELRIDKKNIDALSIDRAEADKAINEDPTKEINEKRKLRGELPVFGGDKIVTSAGVAIAGKDANLSTPVTTDSTGSKKKPIGTKDYSYVLDSAVLAVIDEIDANAVQANTAPLIASMYAKLVKEFGADQVEEIGKKVSFEATKRVNDFITNRSGELVQLIDDTTKKRLKETISLAAETGASISELSDLIHAEFDDFSKYRATNIAVTETTLTYGFSAREAMEQAEIYRSVWMTTRDGKARDSHMRLDGKLTGDDGYFHIDGDKALYPGGFASKKQNIHCRCAIRAYFEGEKSHGMTEKQETELWLRRDKFRVSKESYVESVMTKYFKMQEDAFFKKFDALLGKFM